MFFCLRKFARVMFSTRTNKIVNVFEAPHLKFFHNWKPEVFLHWTRQRSFTAASQTALHFNFCLAPKALPFACLLLIPKNDTHFRGPHINSPSLKTDRFSFTRKVCPQRHTFTLSNQFSILRGEGLCPARTNRKSPTWKRTRRRNQRSSR